VAAILVSTLALGFETSQGASAIPGGPEAWLSVGWLGVLGSGVAYLLYFRLLEAWGATRSSLVTYVMPIVGIALGVTILREQIGLRELAGSALIIGGIALVNSRLGGRRLYGRATAPLPSTRE
ncbi:MAG: DMT family transporter, partial [Chloroflexi bacterium]|nr:DMT family transporter [Chloroflexota bacterium]